MRKITGLIKILVLVLLFGCKGYVSTKTNPQDLANTFQALVSEAIVGSYGSTPGISLTVKSRTKDILLASAGGFDSKEEDNEVGIDQPFRIASITKTFVATAILRLHEMDSLSIYDPISKYISQEHIDILSKDGYDLDKISILHCMQHVSGLYDYAVGEGTQYTSIALADPNRRWTRTEQLQGAVDWGDKLGEPEQQYSYSDTGYILLGETIEFFFNGELARGLRELIGFEKLEMKHTWLESLEPAPDGVSELVHCYFGRDDVTDIDPSIDLYGGGGLVSTTGDLVKFMDALFNREIYDKTETLGLMLSKPNFPPEYNPERDYRCGLFAFEMYGEQVYAHSGLWDVYLLYQPKNKLTVATNFTNRHRYRLVKKVVLTINNLEA